MWIWRTLRMGLFGLVLFNLLLYVVHHYGFHQQVGYTAAQAGGTADSPIYFSPDTNLEEIDMAMIGRAQRTIDVAMYAFTDRRIAAARSILAGEPNISIRVKASNELMHEKAVLYDGHLLRDGSGNWSISAARYQDNEISVSDNRAMAHAFASDFERMWSRTDNTVIQ
jgi:phosphatidylserine/phosphatidylglycerophosphate/cardiolipin synthase-like enzyme